MVSKTVLVLAESFDHGPSATAVAEAIARGLTASALYECDLCPMSFRDASPSELLDAQDFDKRMRAARALVIACSALEDRALAGSVVFEAATRARQAGVPTYAVTGGNFLDPFEARILDLQRILQASTPRGLAAAGRKLATFV